MNKVSLLLGAFIVSIFMKNSIEAQSACKAQFMGGKKPTCTYKDGTLDTTFGNHGTVTTNISGRSDVANGVAVLPCGRIVAVGTTFDGSGQNDFIAAGYDSNGFLDNNFGTNGKVLTNFGTILPDALITSSVDGAFAVAVQTHCNGCDDRCGDCCDNTCDSNCKIVVVGFSDALGAIAPAVARYTCNGVLDTSFGSTGTGLVVLPMGGLAQDVTIQEDNKIVIAGVASGVGFFDFMVARLNCDGELDTTFGCDRSGMVRIDFGGTDDTAYAVKVQKDGKIVVAGYSNALGASDFALARLTPNGRLDATFNGTGKVVTDIFEDSADSVFSLVLMEDCRENCCDDGRATIVAVGLAGVSFALAGYKNNGQLDKQFGTNHDGIVTTRFFSDSSDQAFAATLQKDCGQKCKIVVVGTSQRASSLANFAVARYEADGCLDKSFGVGGKVITDFDAQADAVALAVALQENGKIVAGGFSGNNFGLARYLVCQRCC